MRVAMVSEHASPLAVLGGVDAGGQNVRVVALAAAMGALGVEVVAYTRSEESSLPRRVPLARRVVEHAYAVPTEPIPKDLPLPYTDGFAEELEVAWSPWRPDLAHAHLCTQRACLTSTTSDYGTDEVFASPELRLAEEVDR